MNQKTALWELQAEVIARAVHESNWQEGLYLDPHRTRELSDLAFTKLPGIQGPHLDTNALLQGHEEEVKYMKKQNYSVEEIAAYNLSKAHLALALIRVDMSNRYIAFMASTFKGMEELMSGTNTLTADSKSIISAELKDAVDYVNELIERKNPISFPVTEDVLTEGELLKELLKIDRSLLKQLMHSTYIHTLHRITLMGIYPKNKLGVFRVTSVHVGDNETYFPLPSAVPKMMEEFCSDFPNLSQVTKKYDRILMAARVSHRFVRIHPYSDGNGRVSRLLMNLILLNDHPPVYLKADKKDDIATFKH